MVYRVILEFGNQSRTQRYSTVTEARKSADKLAATYAPKFGQATTTVFDTYYQVAVHFSFNINLGEVLRGVLVVKI